MKVVIAYSGGLDTSAIVALLARMGYEVVTVTVDVGQSEDLGAIEERAYKLGAVKHYTIDAKREFVERFAWAAVKANALYEGRYPLGTALARPLIAAKVVEVARREGAEAIAHGCTSKGNDQVRFDLVIKALAPDLKVIAPVRDYGLTREKEVELLREAGVEPPGKHSVYSIDENLWSRSIEGDPLDDPTVEPPEEVFEWTVDPAKAPNQPLYLEVWFEKGVPTKIDGERMDPVKIVQVLNRLVGSHGFGRIDHIENRLIGFKSREVYEAPAALTLIEAHMDLEKLVLTPAELRFKRFADQVWTDLVYKGLWVEPLRAELQKFIDEVNRWVTGWVKVKVFKGSLRVVARWSPYAAYEEKLVDYSGAGWYPSGEEAKGFIKIWGLHSLTALKARGVTLDV